MTDTITTKAQLADMTDEEICTARVEGRIDWEALSADQRAQDDAANSVGLDVKAAYAAGFDLDESRTYANARAAARGAASGLSEQQRADLTTFADTTSRVIDLIGQGLSRARAEAVVHNTNNTETS